MQVLNLGCGNQTYGTHRVDVRQTPSATHVFDVEEGLQFDEGSFDEIYERNLLEHLTNPGFHLKECYRVLRVGGNIMLITDNASCMRYYVFGTHTGRYKGHRRYFSDNGDRHFAIFTKEHLKNLFEHVGFTILSMSYVDTDFTPSKLLDKAMRSLHVFPLLSYPRIKIVARKFR